jgi:phosphoribosyl-AMP cyclohydrolase
MSSFLDEVRFDANGLVPAIAQDAENGQVLMMAWMSRETLEETLKTGQAVYWSRRRKVRWRKGETSGHTQSVIEARLDCDGDVILLKVRQTGPACHTGQRSCFFRLAQDGEIVERP